MYAIALDGLFWNAAARLFSDSPTLYESWDEAVEAAQEDARLDPNKNWSIEKLA